MAAVASPRWAPGDGQRVGACLSTSNWVAEQPAGVRLNNNGDFVADYVEL